MRLAVHGGLVALHRGLDEPHLPLGVPEVEVRHRELRVPARGHLEVLHRGVEVPHCEVEMAEVVEVLRPHRPQERLIDVLRRVAGVPVPIEHDAHEVQGVGVARVAREDPLEDDHGLVDLHALGVRHRLAHHEEVLLLVRGVRAPHLLGVFLGREALVEGVHGRVLEDVLLAPVVPHPDQHQAAQHSRQGRDGGDHVPLRQRVGDEGHLEEVLGLGHVGPARDEVQEGDERPPPAVAPEVILAHAALARPPPTHVCALLARLAHRGAVPGHGRPGGAGGAGGRAGVGSEGPRHAGIAARVAPEGRVLAAGARLARGHVVGRGEEPGRAELALRAAREDTDGDESPRTALHGGGVHDRLAHLQAALLVLAHDAVVREGGRVGHLLEALLLPRYSHGEVDRHGAVVNPRHHEHGCLHPHRRQHPGAERRLHPLLRP
mmetsp:Transcript_11831/g.37588  ORF Transcript_11831/g.37588 Transcript_11831/m.37588 type:complete len:434 (-) Transcript_11831:6-1307(-)